MRKLVHFLVFMCLTLTTGRAFSQRLDSLLSMYEPYQQERLYFQLDRASYGSGETIWFKGYLMRGILPSTLSKTVYVDFSDANGRVIQHLAYPVQLLGATFGQIQLPDSIYTSSLQMTAYTKWMKNFDTAFFFHKTIKILNPHMPVHKPQAPQIVRSLNLFPEGGWLVAGRKNVVAFKAHDQFGRPIDLSGTLEDQNDKKITSLKSIHDGLGEFSFVPAVGAKYHVKWSDEEGHSYSEALPEVKAAGILLHIQQTVNGGQYTISKNGAVPPSQLKLHFVATLYGQVVYMANVNLSERDSISNIVSSTDFPGGVVTYTVFDDNWQPLVERIAYDYKTLESTFPVEVGFTKLGTGKRGLNEIAVNVPDGSMASMSLSITNADIEKDSTDDIISYLLATGDLRGAVYHPQYYFSDTTAPVRKALDLVMMTHGWRQIDWNMITQHQTPTIKYPADSNYMVLNGRVFGAKADRLRAAGPLFVFEKPTDSTNGNAKNVQQRLLDVQPDGTFMDSTGLFFDSLSVYWQFVNKKNFGDQVSIKFMPNRLPAPKSIHSNLGPFDYSFISDTTGEWASRQLLASYLSTIKSKGELETVVVKGRSKSKSELLEEKYTSGLFSGGNGQFLDLVDDPSSTSYMNIFQYLQARVAGLQISNPMSSNPTVTWRGGTPGFYLDEVPVDLSQLANIPVSDIAGVKVLRPPFMGMGGSNGGVAVYTRRGGDTRNDNFHSSVKGETIAGYSAIKRFYAPDYSTFSDDFDKPDYRSTIFWNPMIQTDKDHPMQSFKFYNNDVSHSFRVVLEGMCADGRLVHIVKTIE